MVLLDASCDYILSLGDYRCYKLQWVVASCSERSKVVVGCYLLWCDAACGCGLSLDDYRCNKLQWVVASCSEMLQGVVGC